MIIDLTDTSSRDIAAALTDARRTSGSPSGLVLTLLIVTTDYHFDEVIEAAKASATAHPSRVIVVTYVDADTPRLDARIEVGEGLPGDLLVLRLHGELKHHGDAICLPLLLPDSPTIVWWPNHAPDDLANDPIGSLADRRITDAAGESDPQAALVRRAVTMHPATRTSRGRGSPAGVRCWRPPSTSHRPRSRGPRSSPRPTTRRPHCSPHG